LPIQKCFKKEFKYVEPETGRKFKHHGLEMSTNSYNRNQTRIIRGKEIYTKIGWKWSQEIFNKKLRENPYLIYWTKNGRPRYKIYEDEHPGKKVSNVWADIPPLSSSDAERLGYPTQKPEKLLERIIKASSNEGDTVLDCFCGCGTTVSVAQRLKRKWIGIDITYQAVNLIKKRLRILENKIN
jgi:DNA modification methylase